MTDDYRDEEEEEEEDEEDEDVLQCCGDLRWR